MHLGRRPGAKADGFAAGVALISANKQTKVSESGRPALEVIWQGGFDAAGHSDVAAHLRDGAASLAC